MNVVFLPYGEGNPYPEQLASALKDKGVNVCRPKISSAVFYNIVRRYDPDVLHLHWLHVFFRDKNKAKSSLKLFLFLAQVWMIKLAGVKVVWTAHNLADHEAICPYLDRLCTSWIVKMSDAVVAYCERSKREMTQILGIKQPDKIAIIPHGHVIDCYENKISRVEARGILGLSDRDIVLLSFGTIRPYKGTTELIEAFKHIDEPGAKLVIAGELYSNELEEQIRESAKDCKNILLDLVYISDNKIQVYMNACDAVVFTFKDMHTSGSIVLAMSFARACIAPRIGCIPEVLNENDAILYDQLSGSGLSGALRQAIARRSDLSDMGKHNFQTISKWSWARVAEMTENVYKKE